MKFILVSIKEKVLDLPKIEWLTIPTQGGEITILPNHEPLITSLVPGILIVHSNEMHTSYAIG
jgi:F0F1-type ATP synthase epsilon subunit